MKKNKNILDKFLNIILWLTLLISCARNEVEWCIFITLLIINESIGRLEN